jgi:hypothetical protein
MTPVGVMCMPLYMIIRNLVGMVSQEQSTLKVYSLRSHRGVVGHCIHQFRVTTCDSNLPWQVTSIATHMSSLVGPLNRRRLSPGISVQLTATSQTGMPSCSAKNISSTSKHQRCNRWFGNSSRAARLVNSCTHKKTAFKTKTTMLSVSVACCA